jgi:hypothetical protein
MGSSFAIEQCTHRQTSKDAMYCALVISICAYNGLSRFYRSANTIQANKISMQHVGFKGVTHE